EAKRQAGSTPVLRSERAFCRSVLRVVCFGCSGGDAGIDFDRMSAGAHILPNLPKVRADALEALPYEPVCAIFRRYLHTEKLKFTPERAMILDAVLRKEGLFEPEQVIDGLKKLGHRVSRATVYRTLSHLQDAGILK